MADQAPGLEEVKEQKQSENTDSLFTRARKWLSRKFAEFIFGTAEEDVLRPREEKERKEIQNPLKREDRYSSPEELSSLPFRLDVDASLDEKDRYQNEHQFDSPPIKPRKKIQKPSESLLANFWKAFKNFLAGVFWGEGEELQAQQAKIIEFSGKSVVIPDEIKNHALDVRTLKYRSAPGSNMAEIVVGSRGISGTVGMLATTLGDQGLQSQPTIQHRAYRRSKQRLKTQLKDRESEAKPRVSVAPEKLENNVLEREPSNPFVAAQDPVMTVVVKETTPQVTEKELETPPPKPPTTDQPNKPGAVDPESKDNKSNEKTFVQRMKGTFDSAYSKVTELVLAPPPYVRDQNKKGNSETSSSSSTGENTTEDSEEARREAQKEIEEARREAQKEIEEFRREAQEKIKQAQAERSTKVSNSVGTLQSQKFKDGDITEEGQKAAKEKEKAEKEAKEREARDKAAKGATKEGGYGFDQILKRIVPNATAASPPQGQRKEEAKSEPQPLKSLGFSFTLPSIFSTPKSPEVGVDESDSTLVWETTESNDRPS